MMYVNLAITKIILIMDRKSLLFPIFMTYESQAL